MRVYVTGAELLGQGAYPQSKPPVAVPYDTSLDATTTERTLGVELPPLAAWLARMRRELESGEIESDPFTLEVPA